jgi:hypothetical protein
VADDNPFTTKEVPGPTGRLSKLLTNDVKFETVETSITYPVAPVAAFQFAVKLDEDMDVTGNKYGVSGGVVTVSFAGVACR